MNDAILEVTVAVPEELERNSQGVAGFREGE